MNLDELKMSWKSLDDRLATTQKLTEQMVFSMVRKQSKSTVVKIQVKLRNTSFFFTGLLILFIAIFVGNPFDYAQWYEFLPAGLYTLLVLAALKIIFQEIISIQKITLSQSNLKENLEKIIGLQERFKIVMDTVWKISMTIGFLFGISLMVRNFVKYGLLKSALLVGSFAFIVLAMFLFTKSIFKKFPDTNTEELKMNLSELDSI